MIKVDDYDTKPYKPIFNFKHQKLIIKFQHISN